MPSVRLDPRLYLYTLLKSELEHEVDRALETRTRSPRREVS